MHGAVSHAANAIGRAGPIAAGRAAGPAAAAPGDPPAFAGFAGAVAPVRWPGPAPPAPPRAQAASAMTRETWNAARAGLGIRTILARLRRAARLPGPAL